MTGAIDAAAVMALSEAPLDWKYKGLPASWWGRTPAEVCAAGTELFGEAVGPVCVLKADALAHNLETMAGWCRDSGVELAPHGKTHMSPQLLSRQLQAGATAVTVATVSQARIYRAFGVTDIVLANEVVDEAGVRWLGAELDADPGLRLVCWVDSVAGVEAMTSALTSALGRAGRPLDVCVEVGMAGGRTGCRGQTSIDEVARAAAASPRLRLVGVAGYEAALGHGIGPDAIADVRAYLSEVRAAMVRLAPLFETGSAIATAGGSTYFDVVADALEGDWRTILRSGCYLTHDDGLYDQTSPLRSGLRSALSVWAQVISQPETGLALVGMGRRDVSFDQDMPVPLALTGSRVVKLNDQHAYLELGGGDHVDIGNWIEFGVSHPCTTFDKWQMIPMLDADDRVVDLIRTYF